MFILRAESTFCAAHKLINYPGACSRLHGHNWRVRLSVRTEVLNDLGMGMDFKDVRKVLEQILDKFDHQYLNEIPPFDSINPTAEQLAKYIYDEVQALLPENVFTECIELYESDKYYVRYSE